MNLGIEDSDVAPYFGESDTPALRAMIMPSADAIEILDGTGPLLSLSLKEAKSIADQITSLLVIWG